MHRRCLGNLFFLVFKIYSKLINVQVFSTKDIFFGLALPLNCNEYPFLDYLEVLNSFCVLCLELQKLPCMRHSIRHWRRFSSAMQMQQESSGIPVLTDIMAFQEPIVCWFGIHQDPSKNLWCFLKAIVIVIVIGHSDNLTQLCKGLTKLVVKLKLFLLLFGILRVPVLLKF